MSSVAHNLLDELLQTVKEELLNQNADKIKKEILDDVEKKNRTLVQDMVDMVEKVNKDICGVELLLLPSAGRPLFAIFTSTKSTKVQKYKSAKVQKYKTQNTAVNFVYIIIAEVMRKMLNVHITSVMCI